jgi:predicted enzyme related to lactoylglutathione lyase
LRDESPRGWEADAMSEQSPPAVGHIMWHDLTVPNADAVRDFYAAVVGWKPGNVAMGGYNDYTMNAPETGATQAGVCHARGPNANLPPQWLMYVAVDDPAAAAQKAIELGGAIVDGPRTAGGYPFVVIRDPAGAVIALIGRQTQAG